MTEQNRREQAAQSSGTAQPGQHQTDPVPESQRTRQSEPPHDTGPADASHGDQPTQPFVVRDKRRKPSPRPRPPATDGGSPPSQDRPGPQPAGSDADAAPGAGSDATPSPDTPPGGAPGQPDTHAAAATPQNTNRRTATVTANGDSAAPAAPGTAEEPGTASFTAELQALRSELDERTRDLQRITAEYANYRRRVDRDRRLVVEQATAGVLNELLGVLDDLDRARNHGDLVGPFGAVAEQLTSVLTKLGLAPFGEKGDAFDPTRHDAVAHSVSTEVTEPTCVEVFRRGYSYGDRLLRPALVAVADPAEAEPAGKATESAAEPASASTGGQPERAESGKIDPPSADQGDGDATGDATEAEKPAGDA